MKDDLWPKPRDRMDFESHSSHSSHSRRISSLSAEGMNMRCQMILCIPIAKNVTGRGISRPQV